MNKAKVSFIVPIYNAETYLACCLESLANQSVRDIEIICVNDCSTDGSLEIMESFAEKDPRIKLINFDKNRGAGAARNAGMEAVSGNFIRMVDSDDYLPLDSTEKLVGAAVQFDSDFVRGGYRNCTDQGQVLSRSWNYPEHPARSTQFRDDISLWAVDQHWTYLYRAETLLATGVKYDESMRNAQDAAFRVDLMPHLTSITSIPETVYYYRNNPASTMRRKREAIFFRNVFSIYDRAYRRLAEPGLSEVADFIFYTSLCQYLPKSIFPTISRDLQTADAEEILLCLKKLFHEHNPHTFFLNKYYSWRTQYENELPLEVKYLNILLQNNQLQEAHDNLDSFQKRLNNEKTLQKQLKRHQNKLSAIQNSTSWKVTAPLRQVANIAKKVKSNL